MTSKCPKRPLTPLRDASAYREVPILPPIQQNRLYPDVSVPPGGIAPIEQPFPPNGVPPNGAQRQFAAPNGPPPYCEYHSAGYGAGLGAAHGCGCQNGGGGNGQQLPAIGVRYFVHGPPQQVGAGEFHQIQQQQQQQMGGAAPIQNGDTVFYYVSPSNNYVPGAEPSFMFLRRRPISYASFAVFCVLAAVFLLVFIKMHADLTQKYLPPPPPMLPPNVNPQMGNNRYEMGGMGNGNGGKHTREVGMPILMGTTGKPPSPATILATTAANKVTSASATSLATTPNKQATNAATNASATTAKPSTGNIASTLAATTPKPAASSNPITASASTPKPTAATNAPSNPTTAPNSTPKPTGANAPSNPTTAPNSTPKPTNATNSPATGPTSAPTTTLATTTIKPTNGTNPPTTVTTKPPTAATTPIPASTTSHAPTAPAGPQQNPQAPNLPVQIILIPEAHN